VSGAVDFEALADELVDFAEQVPGQLTALVRAARGVTASGATTRTRRVPPPNGIVSLTFDTPADASIETAARRARCSVFRPRA
jgi:hypothetical protein